MIERLLAKIADFIEEDEHSFFIVEPRGLPCFVQVAKLESEYLLDVPASNFFEDDMIDKLELMFNERYRKKIIQNDDGSRIVSYQCRFKEAEINKLCYIIQSIFNEIFDIDLQHDVDIIMR
jgi:hypothetical protein